VRLEDLDKLKESNDIIGNRTSDLLACTTVPQSTTLPRAPMETYGCEVFKSFSFSLISTLTRLMLRLEFNLLLNSHGPNTCTMKYLVPLLGIQNAQVRIQYFSWLLIYYDFRLWGRREVPPALWHSPTRPMSTITEKIYNGLWNHSCGLRMCKLVKYVAEL
jgi:hypothetical protein